MSRTIRMARARDRDYQDIEDVSQLIADLKEKATEDMNLDDIPEGNERNEENFRFSEESDDDVEHSVTRKPSTLSLNVHSKGKRTIQIKELDLDIIPPSHSEFMNPDHTGSKIAVIGKPGTGKSSLIRSILFEKSEIFPCGQIYSGTEDSNHSYGKFLPSTFIHNSFDQTAYMDFIRRQKIAKKWLANPWSVCVWDDITEDAKIFNHPIIQGTYKNGRHWKMLHILSLQYSLDIKPVIRTNIDGTFILRETNKMNRKRLFENYASAIDDYSDFCSILDQVTNNYTSLYIHNRVQSNNFEDCVYWYKARNDIPDDFKFGCKEYWMFHEERYNPLYIDPINV